MSPSTAGISIARSGPSLRSSHAPICTPVSCRPLCSTRSTSMVSKVSTAITRAPQPGTSARRPPRTAWSWFDRSLPAEEEKNAIRAAIRRAYSKGIASVHEMFVVEWRGWASLEVFLDAIIDASLDIVTYVGTTEIDKVHDIGFDRIGGDFFLDGSFGSHTAWMNGPYASSPPTGTPATGIAYRDDDEVLELFARAQELDMQVGVHAIGDAAIEQAIRIWEQVAGAVGVAAVQDLGHRIEHFECSSDAHFARAARLGLRASVQPAFDHYWGGESGLYAQRIGWERAREMNRFSSMLSAGLLVGAGSDTTVTPMDPFLQLAALRGHHVVDEQLGRVEALRLHTTGARALADGPSLAGTLEPGAPADLAWLDRDPAEVDVEELTKTEVLGTWVLGAARLARGRGGSRMRAFVRPTGRLRIDTDAVAECRALAAEIAEPVRQLATDHTTVSIERACLRLVGVDGVEGEGTEAIPIPNRVVDAISGTVGLERGALIPFFHAVESGCGDISSEARRIAAGGVRPAWPEGLRSGVRVGASPARVRACRRPDRVGGHAPSRGHREGRGRGEAVVLRDRGNRQHLRGHARRLRPQPARDATWSP